MPHLRPDLQHIANMLPKKSKVLDLGCGEGELLTYLSQHKQIDGRGIEISQQGVSECVRKGLSVIQGDAETDLAHYPDNAFDYVISSQVLQATHHPKEVLGQMLRIATSCIVSIPNFGHWYNRLYLTFRGKMPVSKTLHYSWYETPNIHFCTLKDFDALCIDSGYHIKKKIYLGKHGKIVSPAITKSLGNLVSHQGVYLLT